MGLDGKLGVGEGDEGLGSEAEADPGLFVGELSEAGDSRGGIEAGARAAGMIDDVDGHAVAHEIFGPAHAAVGSLLISLAGVSGAVNHDDGVGAAVAGLRNLILDVHSFDGDVAGLRGSGGRGEGGGDVLLVDEEAALLREHQRLLGW